MEKRLVIGFTQVFIIRMVIVENNYYTLQNISRKRNGEVPLWLLGTSP